MKLVYHARTSFDASLVKAYLESCEIPSTVRGEYLWTLRGFMPMTREMLPTVWVEDSVFERAKELIIVWENTQKKQNHSLRDWKCTQCSEINEGQFSHCWKCNTEHV